MISHLPQHEVTSGVDFSPERLVGLCQHLFCLLVAEVRDSLGTDGQYSLTFESLGDSRRVHLSYWRGKQLMTILLMDCDRSAGGRYLDVLLLSRLFTALPSSATPVSCHGVRVELVKALDSYLKPGAGIQSPPTINSELLEKLIVNPTNLVFGRVDAFSTVEHLVMRLRGATDEEWMQDCPTLLQVDILFVLSVNLILFVSFPAFL